MANRQRPPYVVGGVIKEPEDFYGRELLLEQAFDEIYKGQCLSIVGERRIGKTSLFRYMLQPEIQELWQCAGDDLVYIYLDPQIIWPQTPTAFFRAMLEEIDRHPIGSVPRISETPDENDVLRMLTMPKMWRPIVFIDEFEALTYSDQYPDGFYEFLRGCAVNTDLTLITASSCSLRECCPQNVATSPFPNMFYPLQLGPFEPSELEDFVTDTSSRSGVDLTPYTDDIDRMVGRFPYLVQLTCMAYYRRLESGDPPPPDLYETVLTEVMQQADHYFEHLWESDLQINERHVLASVQKNEPVPEGSSPAIVRLEQKGHLRSMEIGSEALARFIEQHPISGRPTSAVAPPVAVPEKHDGIWIDKNTQIAYRDNEALELTNLEFKLLKALWDAEGGICDSYTIVENVWGSDYVEDVDDQRISALVSRLRRKVEPTRQRPWRYVLTVHGRGLRLGNGKG